MKDTMKRALLIIDVQNEYFNGKLPVTYPRDSFKNILKAMDSADENGVSTILIQHTNSEENSDTFRRGAFEWKIRKEVLERNHELVIEKNLPGSFTGTELESWLRRNDVTTIVISGYMSQMCCDTTARQAMHLGFNVEFLNDATGTLDISNYAGEINANKLHKAILVTQAMRFSKVMSTDEWIRDL